MKLKRVLFALAVLSLSLLSSCHGGYTCPTYAQDNESIIKIVKEKPTNSDINS